MYSGKGCYKRCASIKTELWDVIWNFHSSSSFTCMSGLMLSFLHLSVALPWKFQLLYIMIMTRTATNTMWRMIAYTFVICRGMSLRRQKWLPHFIKHWIHWYGNSNTMASCSLHIVHWIAEENSYKCRKFLTLFLHFLLKKIILTWKCYCTLPSITKSSFSHVLIQGT